MMILPQKHLKLDRCLLGIGAEILYELEHERTVSAVWERVRDGRTEGSSRVTFDWFILALDFLYAIGAVRFEQGVLIRKQQKDEEAGHDT